MQLFGSLVMQNQGMARWCRDAILMGSVTAHAFGPAEPSDTQ
jgi:hypothetical protein